MGYRFGIDLGTTYSAISYYEEFRKDVVTIDVEPFSGSNTLRSVVYYEPVFKDDNSFERHNVIVGETAYRKRHADEDRVVELVKRRMGTDWNREIDGVAVTPELASSEILKALAARAEAAMGEQVREVVVTVPAHFGDPERAATSEAIKLAGLEELALLEEPAAAALAYCLEDPALVSDKLLLVYDLGGGTFDITLVRTRSVQNDDGSIGLHVDTLAKEGARVLGGVDWNSRLQDFAAEKAQQEFSVDPLAEPATRLTFEEKCEEAKRMLTGVEATEVVVTLMGQAVPVTRSEFNDAAANELNETEALFRLVLDEADVRLRADLEADETMLATYEESLRQRVQDDPEEWQKLLGVAPPDCELSADQVAAAPRELILAAPRVMIDVLLCGGATKMPMIGDMIERVTGRRPLSHGNPELLVTRGAAYHAHLLGGDVILHPEGPCGLKKSDMTSVLHSGIGVQTVKLNAAGDDVEAVKNEVLLPKGAPFGETASTVLETAFNDMELIELVFYEGETSEVSECRELGKFNISVPPGRPKGQKVEISLGPDENGVVCGKAKDVASGEEIEIRIERLKQQA